MERRKFTREFKLEAVRLIKERGVSYAQASQDLGVHTSQLRDWVKKFADDVGGTWIDGDGIAGDTAPCGCRRETDSVAGVAKVCLRS